MKEKAVPGSQHLNPLGYPYQTSHQRFWSGWGALGKTTSRIGGVRLQALSSPQHLCPRLPPSVPPAVMPHLPAQQLGSLPWPASPKLLCCLWVLQLLFHKSCWPTVQRFGMLGGYWKKCCFHITDSHVLLDFRRSTKFCGLFKSLNPWEEFEFLC